MASSRSPILAVLDVGTSKVACAIATAEPGGFRILGVGVKKSRGLHRGIITEMEAAEASIRHAVDDAERMAQIQIDEIFVCLSGGQPASHLVGVDISTSDEAISNQDVQRLLRQAGAKSEPGERSVLHVIPVSYVLDGARGIVDPRGMFGRRLGVDVHITTAAATAQTSLESCVRSALLKPADLVSAAYAAGLGGLTDDERMLGTTVVDMGAGVTKIGMFQQGALVHVESIVIGGSHVTNDIARILSTSIDGAERLKTTRGGVFVGPNDDNELIDVPPLGDGWGEKGSQPPLSLLIGVIRPRIEEIFETVRERIESSGHAPIAGRKVVLTGGGSLLNGVERLAQEMLDRPIRRGRPLNLSGLPDSMLSPAYASLAGSLSFAHRRMGARAQIAADNDNQRRSRGFTRLGRWLKENF